MMQLKYSMPPYDRILSIWVKKLVFFSEHEEHVISIVASLMKNCRGPQRQRMLAKFTENDHEKVERLMEMHFKFLEKVTETEQDIARYGH